MGLAIIRGLVRLLFFFFFLYHTKSSTRLRSSVFFITHARLCSHLLDLVAMAEKQVRESVNRTFAACCVWNRSVFTSLSFLGPPVSSCFSASPVLIFHSFNILYENCSIKTPHASPSPPQVLQSKKCSALAPCYPLGLVTHHPHPHPTPGSQAATSYQEP